MTAVLSDSCFAQDIIQGDSNVFQHTQSARKRKSRY